MDTQPRMVRRVRHATAAQHSVQRAIVLPRADGSHRLQSQADARRQSPGTASRAGTRRRPTVTPAASREARAPHVARLERSTPAGRSGAYAPPGLPQHSPTMQYIRPNPEVSLVARSASPSTSCAGPPGDPVRGTLTRHCTDARVASGETWSTGRIGGVREAD